MTKAKYYTIAEVAEILSMSQTALRYVEKTNPKFKPRQIRGRRYYREEDVVYLQNLPNLKKDTKPHRSTILKQILTLEAKFILLKKRLSLKC